LTTSPGYQHGLVGFPGFAEQQVAVAGQHPAWHVSEDEKEGYQMKGSVYVKESPDKGRGVYAARVIRKDEVILEFNGPYVKIESLDGIPREVQDHLFNIGPGEYLIVREPGVYTNHSCDPNAGIVRDVLLVAMRDIGKDEEITFDYSMITSDGWTIECRCGSPSCRKIIGDYKNLPDELKRKYDKYTPDWIKAV
jgi:hypothetical protein